MNTVYILGAGFSMPFMPDQGHLLANLFAFKPQSKADKPFMEFIATQGTLRTWFEEQFGCNYSAVWLEDVFTWFDHLADTIPATDDVRRVQSLRRQLNFALAYYFMKAPTRASALMRRRLRAMEQRSTLSAVITLNWDALLERTGRRFNYGFPVYTEQGQQAYRRRSPHLLKLHGSAHWWMCAKCRSILSDETLYPYVTTRCPVCQKGNTQFDPLLMTPTLTKNPSHGVLSEVWRFAFVSLAQADEIVFMGYSLPQADHAVFHLVSQAKRDDAIVRAILLARDERSVANDRFRTLIPHVVLDFRGIDAFLGLASN